MQHKRSGRSVADKNTSHIPEEVIESLARCILPSIRAYFDSEEEQREFAQWQAEKGKVNTKAE